MRWLRWRRASVSSDGQRAAESALRRTQLARQEAEERQSEVAEAAGALREFRQENHFAARFRASLEGRSA